ncbi:RE2 [Symbiodinium sp. CCMP2592]|nr:RE2 [Symbiodinium sp. CCMP2592]
MGKGRMKEVETWHSFMETLSSWLALQEEAFVRELQLCIPVKTEIVQADLNPETAARSSKLFYYLTQSLAKWERGSELLRSCSKRQGQSACGYEVIRTITSQYSIVSRMEAVFVREQSLKLYQHVGHMKRPTDLIRHLEDSFSKSEAKLSNFPELKLSEADRCSVLLQSLSAEVRQYVVLHGSSSDWEALRKTLTYYEEQLKNAVVLRRAEGKETKESRKAKATRLPRDLARGSEKGRVGRKRHSDGDEVFLSGARLFGPSTITSVGTARNFLRALLDPNLRHRQSIHPRSYSLSGVRHSLYTSTPQPRSKSDCSGIPKSAANSSKPAPLYSRYSQKAGKPGTPFNRNQFLLGPVIPATHCSAPSFPDTSLPSQHYLSWKLDYRNSLSDPLVYFGGYNPINGLGTASHSRDHDGIDPQWFSTPTEPHTQSGTDAAQECALQMVTWANFSSETLVMALNNHEASTRDPFEQLCCFGNQGIRPTCWPPLGDPSADEVWSACTNLGRSEMYLAGSSGPDRLTHAETSAVVQVLHPELQQQTGAWSVKPRSATQQFSFRSNIVTVKGLLNIVGLFPKLQFPARQLEDSFASSRLTPSAADYGDGLRDGDGAAAPLDPWAEAARAAHPPGDVDSLDGHGEDGGGTRRAWRRTVSGERSLSGGTTILRSMPGTVPGPTALSGRPRGRPDGTLDIIMAMPGLGMLRLVLPEMADGKLRGPVLPLGPNTPWETEWTRSTGTNSSNNPWEMDWNRNAISGDAWQQRSLTSDGNPSRPPSSDDGERRGALSERMSVPSFSADNNGDELGLSARSYIRQIEAWVRVTRTPCAQQALLLYQNLKGRAWIEAEELEVAELCVPDGVEKFKAWVAERYQEIEVGKIAEALNGFFRKLRRGPNQSVREFNATFDRAYARLVEIECKLPETARAWAYLSALSLSHSEELAILGSVNNEFVCSRLQRAAVLHEKSLRRPWDKDHPKPWDRSKNNLKVNSANNAEPIPEEGENDDEDLETEVPQNPGEEELYEAFMTAKAQYRDAVKGRNLEPEEVRRAIESKIQSAKQRSFCSVCKQRGHWYKVFMTSAWPAERVPLLGESDNFRFGASRIYSSNYAIVVSFKVGSSWVLVKVAIIHGDLPLLLSRSVLAELGMVYNLKEHKADFEPVRVTGYPLLSTPTGHPAISVHPGGQGIPPQARPDMWDANKCVRGEVQILLGSAAYMADCSGGAGHCEAFVAANALPESRDRQALFPQIFYAKKIPPEVKNLLISETLSVENFVKWWNQTRIMSDFWIETPCSMVRIHVTPRKSLFSPTNWGTQQSLLRDNLLKVLGSIRETFSISCRSQRGLPLAVDFWNAMPTEASNCHQCLWVGRTVFNRRPIAPIRTPPGLSGDVVAPNMELRSAITESKAIDKADKGVPKGLSGMKLADLKMEADRIGVIYDSKVTRGTLMRHIRDYHETPDNTIMQIGRYKGNAFFQIPRQYAEWACREERENGINMSADLKRFVLWYRRKTEEKETTRGPSRREMMEEPERYAKVPYPGSASSRSWEEVSAMSSVDKDQRPLTPSSSTIQTPTKASPAKRTVEKETAKERMHVDPPSQVLEEIKEDAGEDDVEELYEDAAFAYHEGDEDDAEMWDEITGENQDSYVLSLGYYTYGNMRGICANTSKYASLCLYLKEYILSKHPEAKWSSLSIAFNCAPRVHSDFNNLKGTLNYITCAGDFTDGGGLWQENGLVKGTDIMLDPKGREMRGKVLCASGCVVPFRPERFHSAQESDGNYDSGVFLFMIFDISHVIASRLSTTPPAKEPYLCGRKSLWRNAARASAFLTWCYLPSVALLEIGGLEQTLLATSDFNCYTAEPIPWEDIPYDDAGGHVVRMLNQSRPSMLWIHPASPDESYEEAKFFEVVDVCGRWQIQQYGSVVVPIDNLSVDLRGRVLRQLKNLGTVNTLILDDKTCYKASAPSTSTSFMAEGESGRELGEQQLREGAAGITFDKKVPKDVAAALRRLHQNLGHPAREDLVRHLHLAGADKDVIKAAKSLSCSTCARTKGPKSARPAAEPKLLEFGDVVGVDMMYDYDIDGKKVKLFSIVDHASSYQVVIQVPRQTGAVLEKIFVKHWIQVFGAPKVITLDLERGIQDAFGRLADWFHIDLRTSAGQAHWQSGFTERHGKWWKEIFARVVKDQTVRGDEVEEAIAAASSAKNELRRRCGWAPCQIVFGKNPRGDEDLKFEVEEGGGELLRTPDSAQHRREIIRNSAKMAFFKSRAEDKIRRGMSQRARVKPRDLDNGAMVLFWRKPANKKTGLWKGPGVVIGRQDNNYWISPSGRCYLCAPEHLRKALPEEVGGMFALRATKDDLLRLVENNYDDSAGEDDAEIQDKDLFDAVMDLSEVEGEIDEDETGDMDLDNGDLPEGEPSAPSRGDPPRAVRRRFSTKRPEPYDRPGDGDDVNETYMLKRATTKRGRDKQLEKEIPWSMIPESKRQLFIDAEHKQWEEHLRLGALRPLSLAESAVKDNSGRVLSSRFAYRDKNLARRRTDPSVEWKAKSRLVVSGHTDPDIVSGALRTDSPTVSRTAVMTLLQLAASQFDAGWGVAAGDVTAAFLNGEKLDRELYLRQPKHGLPGLHPDQLIKVEKGVFGLIDSPRKWWKKFKKDIQEMTVDLPEGKKGKFFASPLDPCVFQLIELDEEGRRGDGRPICYAAVHVDDILLVGPHALRVSVQEQLSGCFPVEEWEEDVFDFIGSHIETRPDGIFVSQSSYATNRLFEIYIDPKAPGDALADAEQVADNRSLVGALSWLASQSRPDLACGVSMCQQLQARPTIEDVRLTNTMAKRALLHKDEGILLAKIPLEEMVVTVFHDAGWSNAPDFNEDPVYFLCPEDEEAGLIVEGPWINKSRKTKKRNSSVASQLGALVMLCGKDGINSSGAPASILEWRSHACDRVCRSTFGAETMGCIEGFELGQYVRAMIDSFLTGKITRDAGKNIPMLGVTDCRSLYDHMHRDGLPRTPSDRRLAIDIACLRQTLKEETPDCDDARAPLVWVPTHLQRADILTKPKVASDWWPLSGRLSLL